MTMTPTDLDRLRAALLRVTPTQQTAAEGLAYGATHAEAADAAGVARETVSRWAGHHPGFRGYLTELRATIAAERATAEAERRLAIRGRALDVVADRLDDGGATLTDALAVLRTVTAPATRVELPDSPPVPAELLDRERDRLRFSLPTLPPDPFNTDVFAVPPTDHQRAEALAVERLAHASGILDPVADQ